MDGAPLNLWCLVQNLIGLPVYVHMLACGTLCQYVNKHSFALLEISSTLSASSKNNNMQNNKNKQFLFVACDNTVSLVIDEDEA